MDFYKILLDIMEEKSFNIPDVARATGLSDSTIRSIISRKTKNITLEVAFKLSKGLNVSLERLNGENINSVTKLAKDEEELLFKYRKLSHNAKMQIIGMVDIKLQDEQCATLDDNPIIKRA